METGSLGFYINEKTRGDLNNGAVLKLTLSPAAQVARFMYQISSASMTMPAKVDAYKNLGSDMKDVSYAACFVKQGGLEILHKTALEEKSSAGTESPTLKYILFAYSILIAHNIVPYESVPDEFIFKVLFFSASKYSFLYQPKYSILFAPKHPVLSTQLWLTSSRYSS